MDFLKSLLTINNAITIGMGLILVGLIFYFLPRLLKQEYALNDAVRQAMKQEAQALGQTDRLARLQSEEKGIARIPVYGGCFIAIGSIIVVAILVVHFLK